MKTQASGLYERYKLALIPALGLVLAAILFWPSKPGFQPAATSPVVAETPSRAPKTTATPKTWAGTTWNEVGEFNLFDPPPTPEPEGKTIDSTASSERMERERSNSVTPQIQAIYQDARGAIAIVDSKVVRVGDTLDGRRVAEITSSGIVLDDTQRQLTDVQ
jgi:hypothetical protein